MIPLGQPAPAFELPDTIDGKTKTFTELRHSNKATVVAFICNHCPFVIHILDEFLQLAREYRDKGIGFVAISSNSVESHPQDGPDKMKELAREKNFPFPYLYDESQEVAKAFGATCTPDIFVYDSQNKLAYRGQFDDSRPGNDKPVNGADLRAALDSLLEGKAPGPEQRPSIGCNIKWKS